MYMYYIYNISEYLNLKTQKFGMCICQRKKK